MRIFKYQGGYWCEGCADRISKRLDAGGSTWARPTECTDIPARRKVTHCGSGSKCETPLVLPNSQKVGALLPVPITQVGLARLREAYDRAVARVTLLGLRIEQCPDGPDCPGCDVPGTCPDCEYLGGLDE